MGDDGADGVAAADLKVHLGIDRTFDDLGDGAAEDVAGADLGVVQVGADDDRAGLDDGVGISAGFHTETFMKIWRGLSPMLGWLLLAISFVGCKPAEEKAGAGGATDPASASSPRSPARRPRSAPRRTRAPRWPSRKSTPPAACLGEKFQLLTEDTQSKAGEPATVVNKLISRDGVVAILGEVASSRSLEAAPICQQSKIPMISPSSTNPKVTEVGDYIFRVCFIDPFQGTVMANFATKTLKAKKVAVFTDAKSDYSKGLAKFFKEKFVANGGKIAAELNYNGGDKDFKAQLTAIKAANPDAIFVPGYYTEVALICVQAKQLGLTVPLFGGDGWESDKLVQIGGEAVEGNYFSTHYSAGRGQLHASKQFRRRTIASAGRARRPTRWPRCGYDSAMVLADAIKRAGTTDGPKVRDALAATKDFPGVTGKITIERTATPPRPP